MPPPALLVLVYGYWRRHLAALAATRLSGAFGVHRLIWRSLTRRTGRAFSQTRRPDLGYRAQPTRMHSPAALYVVVWPLQRAAIGAVQLPETCRHLVEPSAGLTAAPANFTIGASAGTRLRSPVQPHNKQRAAYQTLVLAPTSHDFHGNCASCTGGDSQFTPELGALHCPALATCVRTAL